MHYLKNQKYQFFCTKDVYLLLLHIFNLYFQENIFFYSFLKQYLYDIFHKNKNKPYDLYRDWFGFTRF